MSFQKPWERGSTDPSDSWGTERPKKQHDSFRRPWDREESGERSERKPFRKPWDREERGERTERKPFRKPWDREERGERTERKPFRKPWDREERGERTDRKPFRKPWDREERGERTERKPFRKPWDREEQGERAERKPFEGHADKPWKKAAPKKPRVAEIPSDGELVYGRQPVREILRANRREVKMLVFADGVRDSEEIAEIREVAQARQIEIRGYKREDIDAWVNEANHQGVIAFCGEYPYVEVEDIAEALKAASGDAIAVIVDHVQDPQNLGSILRTCECAGVSGVVIPADRAAGVTPAAVRASAGAAEHVKIARISNLTVAIERFKAVGAWVTGLEAVPAAKPYAKIDYKGKVVLVVGSEAHGICSPVRHQCDNLARLPLLGSVNSLNAGVATAVAIYEILRQHGANDSAEAFPAVAEKADVSEAESENAGE